MNDNKKNVWTNKINNLFYFLIFKKLKIKNKKKKMDTNFLKTKFIKSESISADTLNTKNVSLNGSIYAVDEYSLFIKNNQIVPRPYPNFNNNIHYVSKFTGDDSFQGLDPYYPKKTINSVINSGLVYILDSYTYGELNIGSNQTVIAPLAQFTKIIFNGVNAIVSCKNLNNSLPGVCIEGNIGTLNLTVTDLIFAQDGDLFDITGGNCDIKCRKIAVQGNYSFTKPTFTGQLNVVCQSIAAYKNGQTLFYVAAGGTLSLYAQDCTSSTGIVETKFLDMVGNSTGIIRIDKLIGSDNLVNVDSVTPQCTIIGINYSSDTITGSVDNGITLFLGTKLVLGFGDSFSLSGNKGQIYRNSNQQLVNFNSRYGTMNIQNNNANTNVLAINEPYGISIVAAAGNDNEANVKFLSYRGVIANLNGNSADGGGGLSTIINSVNHIFEIDDMVTINGSTNYRGCWNIIAINPGVDFIINAPFIGIEAMAGTTATNINTLQVDSGIYKISYKITQQFSVIPINPTKFKSSIYSMSSGGVPQEILDSVSFSTVIDPFDLLHLNGETVIKFTNNSNIIGLLMESLTNTTIFIILTMIVSIFKIDNI